VTKLSFIAETPSVYLALLSYNAREVVASWDIYYLLMDQRFDQDWFRWVVETAVAKLPVDVAAPDIHPALVIEGHGEIDAWGKFGDVIEG
jgi:hypothetical protein